MENQTRKRGLLVVLSLLTLMIVLGLMSLVSCSQEDDNSVVIPTPFPTPAPIPVPPPAFLKEPNFTLVFALAINPQNANDPAPFFDLTRSSVETWGTKYTETVYVDTASGVRREIDNKKEFFLDVWKTDEHVWLQWKTDALKAPEGSVTSHPFADGNPLQSACHLNFTGDWVKISPDVTLPSGQVCQSLRLNQPDGSRFLFLIDNKTGYPVHFQSPDGGILCTIISFTPGTPAKDLFTSPPGLYVDKQDK